VEFAERGFAGAGVDRIARRARLNKAMIYYHFANKAALYREILRETFRATGTRARAIAQGPGTPDQKVRHFIAALAGELLGRPHFPAIMLRELAEKGRHLDEDTLLELQALPRTFQDIVAQGVRSGEFRRGDPMLAYYAMAGPLLFFAASAPVRDQLSKLGAMNMQASSLSQVVAHVCNTVVHALREGAPAEEAPGPRERPSGRGRLTAQPRRAADQARRSTQRRRKHP
jgi:AcrR family transcriptional regulator